METTFYKVIIFVEDDIAHWSVHASKDNVSWYVHAISGKAFTSLQYNEAIEDAASFIFDKRYRVPVYHHGVKQPIDYLFVSDMKQQLRLMSQERSIRTKGRKV